MAAAIGEERLRDLDLNVMARLQRLADDNLKRLDGIDGPMHDGGPGREHEVVHESAIGFYAAFKGKCVDLADRIRNNDPLL